MLAPSPGIQIKWQHVHIWLTYSTHGCNIMLHPWLQVYSYHPCDGLCSHHSLEVEEPIALLLNVAPLHALLEANLCNDFINIIYICNVCMSYILHVVPLIDMGPSQDHLLQALSRSRSRSSQPSKSWVHKKHTTLKVWLAPIFWLRLHVISILYGCLNLFCDYKRNV